MNEPRFIELLNLYVDQQLSAQEAAELEAEIQRSPARRRTYQQYCRMQKGCALLFEHERTTAPSSTALARALADADRKIVAFPEDSSRRVLWPAGFSVAALAAAACVALVVVFQANQGVSESLQRNEVATVEQAPASVMPGEVTLPAITTAPTAQVAMASVATEEFKPIFMMQPTMGSAAKSEGLFVSLSEDDARLQEWTHQVHFKPLRQPSIEEFVFDDRSKVEKPVTMQFSAPPEEEMTVIQFTR